MNEQHILQDIARLGPWFHNLHLPDNIQTVPNHRFGDFSNWKWQQLAPHLPVDPSGWNVLDIGCNAGFYSIELARRGARVLGIDKNPHFLAQARWAMERLALADACRFECRQVYDLARMNGKWDLVLFMGVFYHLRYPLLGLDIVAEKVGKLLVLQSVLSGEAGSSAAPQTSIAKPFARLSSPYGHAWPSSRAHCHDATNWWIPNRSAMAGMLRSTRLSIQTAVTAETFICAPGNSNGARGWNRTESLAATGRRTTLHDTLQGVNIPDGITGSMHQANE